MPQAHPSAPRRSSSRRGHDRDLTRQNILAIATKEFADKGYSGARVDEIAARIDTSKRMIYYYFGDKEGLFIAALEEAYRRIRQIEATLDLAHHEPDAAIRTLVGFTFDYQNSNEDFVRLVMVENIHKGAHLRRSRAIQDLNVSVINTLRDIHARGVEQGMFRDDVDIIDLHMTISALCFFNVSNRATFSQIFKRDMAAPEILSKRRETVIDLVIRYLER